MIVQLRHEVEHGICESAFFRQRLEDIHKFSANMDKAAHMNDASTFAQRLVALEAARDGVSLNNWVAQTLSKAVAQHP